ncbi:MAG: BACON domain-containing protein, partial [Phycisphaerales bacterium]
FSAAGGSGSVEVTTNGAACEWSATSDAAWLVITSGASGSGASGTIEYLVATNEVAAPRVAIITVAGFTHVVEQAAAACEVLGITPLSAEIEADGGVGFIELATNGESCGWSATSDVPWIVITSGSSGSGFSGEVAYSVAANPDSVSRVGIVTVSGFSHVVSQAPRVNVPGDFDTINEALANVPDGSTIVIEPGTYPGPIDLTGRSVVLEGAAGAEVIIDGSGGDGPAIIVTAPEGVATGGTSVFRFLTIRGGSDGSAVPPFDSPVGGGVLIIGADVVIEDCKIVDNASANGAGLAAIGASLELNRVEFRGNVGSELGGGMLLRDCEAVLIDVVIAENFANVRGGGIDAQGGTLTLVGVLVEENETAGQGGGIAWLGGTGLGGAALTISGSDVILNIAASGGGLWIAPGVDDVLLESSVVCNNEPDEIVGEYVDGGDNDVCDGCFGDLTGDGVIDGADLSVLLGYWGPCGLGGCEAADLTGDGQIDGADLSVMLGGWGGCVP